MVKEFAEYRGLEPNTSPHQLYRYEDGDGRECVIALDFTEVMNISFACAGPSRPAVQT